MANQEQLDILKQGVEIWNQWREEHEYIRPDLSSAELDGANLGGADLWRVDLFGAELNGSNLFKANLSEADLSQANLRKANLSESFLEGASLFDANLREADLSSAYLNSADLRGANLKGANLRNAHLSGAYLEKADLSSADLRSAVLDGATLIETDLSSTNLHGANLSKAVLVETNLREATLTQCSVYGISVWNVVLDGTKQDGLVITREGEPTIKVDDLEVAQFIYLLLNHKKLRNVLNAVTDRGVLLLGRFGGGGLEVLQAIAAKLREENYLPIIFDFDRPQDRNFTETVKTLAGLSRYIIADLSGPSVPQELYATVPHFKIPFVPIIEAGRKPFAMAVDLLEYPWVVRPPVTFTTTEELLEQLPTKVIAPAEEKHQARQKLLDELFNRT